MEDFSEALVDVLILALAAQVDASEGLVPDAVEVMADLGREDTGALFGQMGLLGHYGTQRAQLERLMGLISAAQRDGGWGGAFAPGDRVRVAGAVPPGFADHDEQWLRSTVLVVRYVGRDGTLDVQTELDDDYVIVTVPAGSVAPVP